MSLLVLSCGYSLSSKSNPHIKTVAVPIFDNDTLEKGVEDLLTAELINVLQENRSLTLTDEKRADSVLIGRIVDYRRTVHTYDTAENVQEYKVEILVRVEYEDRKKRKTLWEENRMLGWGIYNALEEEEEAGQLRAIVKLAEDIKTKTVEGW